MEEVGLAAYTNRLSGRPGDTIRFHVSATTTTTTTSSDSNSDDSNDKVRATLTRCICADPNPKGPGCIEEDSSEWFEQREFVGRHQAIQNGSCARSRDAIHVPSDVTKLVVEIWMFPTHDILKGQTDAGYTSDMDMASWQCVWSWGELGLYLKPNGHLSLCHGKESTFVSVSVSVSVSPMEFFLSPRKWYHCQVTMENMNTSTAGTWQCELIVMRQERISKKMILLEGTRCGISQCISSLPKSDGHPFELATGGTFNGKLENPRISILIKDDVTTNTNEQVLIGWDTSQHMSEWTIPSSESPTASPGKIVGWQ